MPIYLKIVRIIGIALGSFIICVTSALLYNKAIHARPALPLYTGIVCVASGLILVAPVRKLSATRFAPFMFALTLAQAGLFTIGFAIGVWRGVLGHYQFIFAVVWLVLCGQAEFARRIFVRTTNETRA